MLDPETCVLSSIDLAHAISAMHGLTSDSDDVGEPDSTVFWTAYPECVSEEALVDLLDYLKQQGM